MDVIGRVVQLSKECAIFIDMNKVENDIWSIVLHRSRRNLRLVRDDLHQVEEILENLG
jgi:hypothetical protein